MIITRKQLHRRTLLRGAGTALALPLLDAMAPALSAAPKPVKRLGYFYIPMGATIASWTPPTEGTLVLSPTLASLAKVREHITVITNLENKNGYSAGNHATANASFLSCAKAKMTEGSDYQLATTVDQLAAKQIGRETPLPSLELSMDLLNTVGNCDNGFACVYQNNLSWASPTSPLPAEAHPRVVFERLFGDGGSKAERRAELKRNASILDWVNEDIAKLQKQLGASDRAKVGHYLESVREVERRIQLAEKRTADSPAPDADRPIGVPAAYGDHARLMFDLQVLALQADVTRVLTFQMAREASTRVYTEAGVNDPHHPTTHHANDPVKVAKVAKINAFHVSLFAAFLEKLKSIPDGDGSLLDQSLFLFGSGMGNPDIHDHVNLPVFVAGRSGGKHIRYKTPEPIANLHLTLLERAGLRMESFADSSSRIAEL